MPSVNLSIRTAEDAVCPACQEVGITLFFEIESIPVNCTTVFRSYEEAIRVPRGDLSLGFCEVCGYIYNVSYDASLLGAAGHYEDQQGFSPTFKRYSDNLAEYLVEKYDLHGRNIVEIGCGKGDFLRSLVRRGNNTGVGIDPIGDLGTPDGNENGRLTLIAETFTEEHGFFNSRLIICRHTLEHIEDPLRFVSAISRAVGSNTETEVFFEVPDVVRILNERAFWDIYYEHCGYFSTGTMARLFRRCGFEVTHLEKVYGGQYVILEARKSEHGSTGAIRDNEEAPPEMQGQIAMFCRELQHSIHEWTRIIEEAKAIGKKIAVWGSGSKCVAFLSTLHIESTIDCVVDMNPKRHGMFMPGSGREIACPDELKRIRPEMVIVMNRIYEQEIRMELKEMGLSPEVLAL